MRALALAAVVALLAACQPAPPQPTPTVEAVSPFPPDTGVVLAGDAARGLANQCSRITPGPVQAVWTPDAAQIAGLEAALPALIDAELKQRWPNETLTALGYYRQYAGLVVAGRRIIYVNGVDHGVITRGPDPDESWRKQPIGICDGGPITFGVEYDPQAKTFADFAFNGAF